MAPLAFTGFPDWVQWIILLGAIAAALTGIGVLVRKGWKALTVMVKFGEAIPVFLALPQDMKDIKDILAGQNDDINGMKKELHENGGGSLKDAVVSVRKETTANSRRLARVETGVKGLYGTVAQLSAQADQINITATVDRKLIGDKASAQATEIGDAATADRRNMKENQ